VPAAPRPGLRAGPARRTQAGRTQADAAALPAGQANCGGRPATAQRRQRPPRTAAEQQTRHPWTGSQSSGRQRAAPGPAPWCTVRQHMARGCRQKRGVGRLSPAVPAIPAIHALHALPALPGSRSTRALTARLSAGSAQTAAKLP
jgi:hypothetical protein